MTNDEIIFSIGKASLSDIKNHLTECSAKFVPPLYQTVNIADYSEKIFNKATTFEAWIDNKMIGLLAVYLNNTIDRIAYITNVSVTPQHYGKGIARELLKNCFLYGTEKHFVEIRLEVNEQNLKAKSLYQSFGFIIHSTQGSSILMKKDIQEYL